ncbi:uncharacterized protein SPSK_09093 [Sporothrix schenckii 1099-18]|uniref:Integral membrane protein n=1 Tax=Sporothrix schenckii 1099-18 TaxID=1397361 RepID=A0A0F2M7A9_SPOSC|nr:uncharacterized protein SPSK_09093 [Sporothrix schenckii 1099-18]KJR84720.1 integral membrane protein [Sporothrix schenckii 1099-18]
MSQDRHAHLPRRIANAHHASSPVSFLNPTTRYVKVPAKKPSKTPAGADVDIPGDNIAQEQQEQQQQQQQQQQQPPSTVSPQATQHQSHVYGAYQVWRSRDNRKGRHAIVLTNDFFRHRHLSLHGGQSPEGGKGETQGTMGSGAVPRSTNSWRGIAHILWKMLVRYPVWDVSYDVAIIFTIGSVVWVINSFFVWLPLAAPWTEFAGEETMGGGITAVIGASIFEVGAVLGLLEAVNENRADCFGWALEEALESGFLSLQPSPDDCKHAHVERTRLFSRRRNGRHRGKDKDVGQGGAKDGIPESSVGGKTITDVPDSDLDNANTSSDTGSDDSRIHPQRRRWTWWPSWTELRTVYAREMGFWACLIQLFGATVFWISGFTGLPPVADRLSTAGTNGAFWAPQVIGGTGFIVSSWLFMLETQRKWYLPAPHLLGWHIGLWNMIGAIGFTLCGALGFGAATSAAVTYASTLSTFIGSWAFLIGSIIQWYESLDKHPIQIQDSLPSHVPP